MMMQKLKSEAMRIPYGNNVESRIETLCGSMVHVNKEKKKKKEMN